MTTPDTWRPVPLRLRVTGFDGAHFGEDLMDLRWNAEDGGLAQRIFRPGDWDIRPAWADGVTRPAPARRPRRGLSRRCCARGSSIAAPALLKLGVPLIVSHMFVFYYGIIADLTPPVALAALAAAGPTLRKHAMEAPR